MLLAVIGISTPSFVVATLLIVVFAVTLRWVPTSGWEGLWSPRAAIPVFALALGPLAAIARYARSSMLEVIRTDYVRTARAKGLREGLIVLRHAAKNALIPVVTIAGIHLAFVVTGSFYVEAVAGRARQARQAARRPLRGADRADRRGGVPSVHTFPRAGLGGERHRPRGAVGRGDAGPGLPGDHGDDSPARRRRDDGEPPRGPHLRRSRPADPI